MDDLDQAGGESVFADLRRCSQRSVIAVAAPADAATDGLEASSALPSPGHEGPHNQKMEFEQGIQCGREARRFCR